MNRLDCTPISDTYSTEEDTPVVTEPICLRKEKKKIVRRRSGDSEDSNSSRRSLKGNKPAIDLMDVKYQSRTHLILTEATEMTPKLRNSCSKQPTHESYTFVRMNHSAILKKAALEVSMLREHSLNKPTDGRHCNCAPRISLLEEEIRARNQEIESIEEEKVRLRRINRQSENFIKGLQESNKVLTAELQASKEQVKLLNLEKRKLQSQKQSLVKKVTFLQKINFSTDTKNIQSYREEHLEKELQHCREKMAKQKSQVEKMLQSQLNRTKEQFFNLRKTVQSLQISNDCLQKRLDERQFLEHTLEDYNILKVKYRKFLVQHKELKKGYERLQEELASLQVKTRLKSEEELSLDLSVV